MPFFYTVDLRTAHKTPRQYLYVLPPIVQRMAYETRRQRVEEIRVRFKVSIIDRFCNIN